MSVTGLKVPVRESDVTTISSSLRVRESRDAHFRDRVTTSEKYDSAGIESYMMIELEGKVLDAIRDGEERLTIQIGG